MKDPYGSKLRSAPRPWCGTRAAGPPVAVVAITPAGSSSEVWHSPPGSAKPYQEDPWRSTQLITAVPGSRPRAGTVPNTAVGCCASACARPGLAVEHRDQSGANTEGARPGSSFPLIVLGVHSTAPSSIALAPRPAPRPCLVPLLPWR